MMVCPRCGGTNHKVIDSRNVGNTDKGIIRKRLCLNCGKRWKTNEIFDCDAEELLLWKKLKKALDIQLNEECLKCNKSDFSLRYNFTLKKYTPTCEKAKVCEYINKQECRERNDDEHRL